jgi:NAD dependent epimerase/dehydratase family enzyme
MSWIHLDDMVRLLIHAIETPGLNSPLNGTAPNPVRNSEFTTLLGRTLGRPAMIPVPEFAVRLLFGEMATVLTSSQRALPEATLKSGFTFEHEQLGPALVHLLVEKRSE